MQLIALMMITKKNVNTVLKGLIAAMPAIPYIMKSRQRTSVTAYVIGGLGFAVAGGLAALMFFSPRTRTRALTAAKDTVNKVNTKIADVRHNGVKSIIGKGDNQQATSLESAPLSNGLSGHDFETTTGL
jgi:hypothetical protein